MVEQCESCVNNDGGCELGLFPHEDFFCEDYEFEGRFEEIPKKQIGE